MSHTVHRPVGIAVDPDGNVYGAEGPISRQAAGGGITKYRETLT